MVQILLEYGVDVNVLNSYHRYTLRHGRVCEDRDRDLDKISILVEKGNVQWLSLGSSSNMCEFAKARWREKCNLERERRYQPETAGTQKKREKCELLH